VLTFATPGDLSVTYTTRAGSYTKIGQYVQLQHDIVTATFTHTTASGNVNITGLPFTSGTTLMTVGALAWDGITKASYTSIVSQIAVSSSILVMLASGSGVGVSSVTAVDMPSGGTVRLRTNIGYSV